ncbi:hypothetical protein A1O3_04875 [Capronia epimyces CBS 606.96]|uniref:Transcription factor domain-containing protein n=1 Tax=Capronia epimyces CBS 606.96 TaxID=1182542 RepID=W9XVE5_9EURO|nr:uncharacterized protein A1O3_04875 [Capronia epimyces CBS 606.96]EXJ84208.1 hypothetical protein A1O3_04875 [Capronia epimyces CBS 606.96]
MTPASWETCSDELPDIEATENLRRFREEMIPFIPYIYLPPDTTALQLRDTYPFFWLAVMSVASKSFKTRSSLGKQARKIIAQKVVAGDERSLDLLFGILTYVTWSVPFPRYGMDKHFACLASQLAVTLVWDLGLQQPPPELTSRSYFGIRMPMCQPPARNERTIEERRAVLGAFVITSRMSQTFKAADGLRWSPHLDEYLSYLAHNSTLPQDKVLVAQVKLQLIVNQIHYSSWKTSGVEIPPPYVDALQSQLDDIAGVNGTSIEFEKNPTMLELYHFTTLIIHESAIAKSPTSRPTEPALRRYEAYQRLLSCVKAWLDAFFSMSLEMYYIMPCSTYSQLKYVICCLYNITTSKDTAWNSAAAREVVDLTATLDKVLHIFEQLRSLDDGGEEDEAVSFGIRQFHALKMAWQSELASRDRDGEDDTNRQAGIVDGDATHGPGLSPGLSLNWVDYDMLMLPDMSDLSWQ